MLEKFYARLFLYGGWLLGPLIIYAAVSDFSKTRALEDGSSVVQARVVETNVRSGVTVPTTHEVRYAFDVGGVTYTYSDAVGEHDRWAELTPEAYERARTERTVAVRYDPSDPWKNQPAGTDPTPLWLDVLGILVGAALTISSLVVLATTALAAYDRRKGKAAAAEGE